MSDNKLMQQVIAIFSVFMVAFYLGAGTFLIFYSDFSSLPKAVRVILGSTFVLYGIFRAYGAYIKIIELFFTKDNENE